MLFFNDCRVAVRIPPCPHHEDQQSKGAGADSNFELAQNQHKNVEKHT